MEKINFIPKAKQLVRLLYQFCKQQEANNTAMQLQYRKQWPGDTVPNGYTSIVIEIIPYGHLYRVIQRYYLWNELQREYSWVTNYCWHSNGYLLEIGGYRCCIFDPLQKLLYLETPNGAATEKKVEIYTAI
jgi:hypothetical protein